MSVEASIQPIDRDIELLISEMFSLAARSAALADFARDALGEADAQNTQALGYTPTHTTVVDGTETDNLDGVRPDGTISFNFDLIGDVFGWILEQLRDHAPVLTGAFRDSIKCYADGTEFDVDGEIPQASQYVFLSNVAYARKIEAGESSQAPDGVFQVIATMAAQRYGNQAKIRFSYISPADGGIVDWAQTASARTQAQRIRGGNKLLHTDWLTSVPAIVITVK